MSSNDERDEHLVELIMKDHWTLAEAGELYDISRERVRQILEERGVRMSKAKLNPNPAKFTVTPKLRHPDNKGSNFYKHKGYTSQFVLVSQKDALKLMSYEMSADLRRRVTIIELIERAIAEFIDRYEKGAE